LSLSQVPLAGVRVGLADIAKDQNLELF
jgi:hypothetical protein